MVVGQEPEVEVEVDPLTISDQVNMFEDPSAAAAEGQYVDEPQPAPLDNDDLDCDENMAEGLGDATGNQPDAQNASASASAA